ncbi:MAG: LAGLIDADG family homing endonuclease [Patescibacteria group bacterium]
MAEKENSNIQFLINQSSCFDLQFRKDTRYERPNSPTYYRWKVQFIVTAPKGKLSLIKKIRKTLRCGNIHIIKNQARFSVQKIDDVVKFVIPFFNKNHLAGKKKKDFELWQKAVEIIYRNKGKYIAKWGKNDLISLIEIHKLTSKYKNRPRKSKWVENEKLMVRI